MSGNNGITNSSQGQQVFGSLEVQRQYVNYATGRRCNRIVTYVEDVYVPSKTSIRNFSQADLNNKKVTEDGKSISYKEYAKQNGGEFLMDGEGRTIYIGSKGSKHVLDTTKNEWVPMNKFYGDKALEVNANIKHAQKASFIERYGLISGPDGKYQLKDSSKDTRTYDFDLTGENLKVRLSDGLVKVDGELVESKKPYIYEKGEWRIDENSGPVLRDDLNTEIANRKVGDETLASGLDAEAKARQAGDKALTKGLSKERKERKAGDEKLTSDLTAETTERKAGDAKLTGDLAAETTERKAGDAKLTSDLTAETTARKAGDAMLTKKLGNEATARTKADTKLTNALNDEVKTRTEIDIKLIDAIANEVTARTDVDKAEAAARKAGDAKLTGALKALTKALGNEATVRADANTAETAARTAGDTDLADKISRNGKADEVQDEKLSELERRNCELAEEKRQLAEKNAELERRLERLELQFQLQQVRP